MQLQILQLQLESILRIVLILESIGFLKKWLKTREKVDCIFGIHPKRKRKTLILIQKIVNFVMRKQY